MPAVLRFPSTRQLPAGRRRDFAEHMFDIYKQAGRPPLRVIDAKLESMDHLEGTASKETVRRVLTGQVVPPRWATVDAIISGLCALAGLDPDGPRWADDEWNGRDPESPTWRCVLKARWNDALDEDPAHLSAADPWAATSEPPF